MSSDRASWHTGARTQGATCKEPRVARHCCRMCAVWVVCSLPREERVHGKTTCFQRYACCGPSTMGALPWHRPPLAASRRFGRSCFLVALWFHAHADGLRLALHVGAWLGIWPELQEGARRAAASMQTMRLRQAAQLSPPRLHLSCFRAPLPADAPPREGTEASGNKKTRKRKQFVSNSEASLRIGFEFALRCCGCLNPRAQCY